MQEVFVWREEEGGGGGGLEYPVCMTYLCPVG